MGAKELAAVAVHHRSAIGHAGEIEHHLVDLRLAVAAHSNHAPALGKVIEQRNHALGSVIARKVVAGPVVKQVAQKNDAVGLLGLNGRHQALGPVCRTVNVRCDKKLHE